MNEIESIFLARRQVLLQKRIDQNVQEAITASVLYLNAVDSTAPITLFIDCDGGATGSGHMLVDVIRNSAAPVNGIVVGAAFSMAFNVLQACRRRTAYEHAKLLFHGTKLENLKLDRDDLDEFLAECLKRDRESLEFLAGRSGRPVDELQKWSKAERQFMAPEAKALGFLDDVIAPPA